MTVRKRYGLVWLVRSSRGSRFLLHGLWRPKSSIDINQMTVDIFLFNFCDMEDTYQAFAMSLIHFYPMFVMTQAIGQFGNQVVRVIAVSTYDSGRCMKRFLRVRIQFDFWHWWQLSLHLLKQRFKILLNTGGANMCEITTLEDQIILWSLEDSH